MQSFSTRISEKRARNEKFTDGIAMVVRNRWDFRKQRCPFEHIFFFSESVFCFIHYFLLYHSQLSRLLGILFPWCIKETLRRRLKKTITFEKLFLLEKKVGQSTGLEF